MNRKIEESPERCKRCQYWTAFESRHFCRKRPMELQQFQPHENRKVDGVHHITIYLVAGYFVDCEFFEEK